MTKKNNPNNKFLAGDYVVYPAHGVGKVADVAKQKVAGQDLELIVVNFEKDKMTLRVPFEKAPTIGLRQLADTNTMADALSTLKNKPKIKKVMWSRRAQEYETKINSGDPILIAEVIRDLHRTENLADQSYSERQIYDQALDRLSNEFAAIEQISAKDASVKLLDIINASRGVVVNK
ncbi:MAG: CarD family transcriptional regulator [Alphaproteobacteria bacterium]